MDSPEPEELKSETTVPRGALISAPSYHFESPTGHEDCGGVSAKAVHDIRATLDRMMKDGISGVIQLSTRNEQGICV